MIEVSGVVNEFFELGEGRGTADIERRNGSRGSLRAGRAVEQGEQKVNQHSAIFAAVEGDCEMFGPVLVLSLSGWTLHAQTTDCEAY